MRYPIFHSLLILLLCATPLMAQDPSSEEMLPPALETYLGREVARTMHYAGAPWLIRESREREEECAAMLSQLGVEPGMTVCDMGCGNGFYSLQLAELVGEEGKVLAVDIQPEMLRLLRERAHTAEIENIEPVLGTLIDPRLPEGEVDLVVCVDVYHEFSHPVHMLEEIRDSLAEGGQLVLVEFRLEDPDVPIKLLHKMTQEQIMRELPANGFKLVRQFDLLPQQHLMFFARDDDDSQDEIELRQWERGARNNDDRQE